MMNPMLLQLLASRQGGAMNPAVQEWLARLQSGAEASGGHGMKDMLAQLAQNNPALASAIQQMTATAATRTVIDAETQEIAPGDADLSCRHTARHDYYQETETLRARADTALAELAVCGERLERCAAALGACGLCWGADPACRACRGRGRPGFALPDEILFEEMIVPALQLVRSHRLRSMPATRLPPNPLTVAN